LISFKEGLRQRILYGVVIFALLMMMFAVLISGLFLRDISKIVLDFCLSAVNLGGLLVPFFLAIHLLAKDIERKTIFSILSRPISRGQYIIGKFGGLLLLTGSAMLVLTVAALFAVWGAEIVYGSRFFATFSICSLLTCVWISYMGVMLLNAMVVLWCSITTSPFLATLLTIFTYIIGETIDDVVRFLSVKTPGVEITKSVQYAVDIVQYLFPNLSAFDVKLQAAHGLMIPAGDVVLLGIYALAYIGIVLSISVAVFARRDLV
jgi:ABC-type transport system involved in multi-copper enzyme maturation permease subunit